jgi:hypothetical protein
VSFLLNIKITIIMKRGILVLSVLLLLPLVSVNLVSGGEFYVDMNNISGPCSDDNPGTIDQPWCTVIKGVSSAMPGDTIYFREGVYRQTDVIHERYFAKNATADARLTFKGYPGEEAVITPMKLRNDTSYWTHEMGEVYSTPLIPQTLGPNNIGVGRIPNAAQDGIPLMLMTGYDTQGYPENLTGPGQWARSTDEWEMYIWANGGGNPGNYYTEITEFPNGGSTTFSIHANVSNDSNEADYLTFDGLVIEGGYYPLRLYTDYVEVKNCVIRKAYSDGIKSGATVRKFGPDMIIPDSDTYWQSIHGLIENNEIYHFGESGIDITGGDYWIIRNNTIHDSLRNNYIREGGGNGIGMKNNNVGTLVEKNVLYNINSSHEIINLGGASGSIITPNEGINLTVRNNIIYNVQGRYLVRFLGCINCAFYNNIIYGADLITALVVLDAADDLNSTGNYPSWYDNRSNVVANNIFTNYSSARNYIVYSNYFDGLVADYNVIDGTKRSNYKNIVESFEEFSNRGFEQNSVFVEPDFVDAASYDFHFIEGSPGIDQGRDLAGMVDDDFDGNARPVGSGWDMGAFEFQAVQVCGNNILEDPEECDGTDIGGETCQTQGFDNGTLSCSGCAFDVSLCFDYHPADTDQNGCIGRMEITVFIDRWYVDSAQVSMVELVRALEAWKTGC